MPAGELRDAERVVTIVATRLCADTILNVDDVCDWLAQTSM